MLSSVAREETNTCPRVPIGGRAVLSERAPAREGLRPLLPPCGIVAKMRPPDAVFATCRRPSVYIPSKPALLYCPSSLRVDPFLLPSAIPKPPRLLLLLEVKLVHTVDSKRWFKQGRKWESCSMNLGLGFETGESSNICHCLNNRISYLRKHGCLSPYRFRMSVSVSFLSAQSKAHTLVLVQLRKMRWLSLVAVV